MNYIGITVHWIDGQFNLNAAILSLSPFNEEKSADNLQAVLKRKLDEWELSSKVLLIVISTSALIMWL